MDRLRLGEWLILFSFFVVEVQVGGVKVVGCSGRKKTRCEEGAAMLGRVLLGDIVRGARVG